MVELNRPARIHFFEDAAPLYSQLPERYQKNVDSYGTPDGGDEVVHSLLVQHAFYIDFAPHILRTRVGGTKDENPIDFTMDSVALIEWYYGSDVPEPLEPWAPHQQSRND